MNVLSVSSSHRSALASVTPQFEAKHPCFSFTMGWEFCLANKVVAGTGFELKMKA
jgi:hypothetical protein